MRTIALEPDVRKTAKEHSRNGIYRQLKAHSTIDHRVPLRTDVLQPFIIGQLVVTIATFPAQLALLNEMRAMAGAPRVIGPFSAESVS